MRWVRLAIVLLLVGVIAPATGTAAQVVVLDPAVDCLNTQLEDFLNLPPDELPGPPPGCPALYRMVDSPVYNPFKGEVQVPAEVAETVQIGATFAVVINPHDEVIDLGFDPTTSMAVGVETVPLEGTELPPLSPTDQVMVFELGAFDEEYGVRVSGGPFTPTEGRPVFIFGHSNPRPDPGCAASHVDRGVVARLPGLVWDENTGASPEVFNDSFFNGNLAVVSNCINGELIGPSARVLDNGRFTEMGINAADAVGRHGFVQLISGADLAGITGVRTFDFETFPPLFTEATAVGSTAPADLTEFFPIEEVVAVGSGEPEPEPALLTIIKEIEGEPTDDVFVVDVTGFDSDETIGPFALGDGEIGSAELAPGTYGVGEEVPEGWLEPTVECSTGDSGAGGASFEVAPGDEVTCTITNTRESPPEPAVTPADEPAVTPEPDPEPTPEDTPVGEDEGQATTDGGGGGIPPVVWILVALVFIGFGGWWLWSRVKPEPEPQPAKDNNASNGSGDTDGGIGGSIQPAPEPEPPITQRLGEDLRLLKNRLSRLMQDDSEANQEAIISTIRELFRSEPRGDAVWLFNVAVNSLGGLDAFEDVLDFGEEDTFQSYWDCYHWLKLEETDTDLGGMFSGDFDAVFDEENCRMVITVKVKFEYADGISAEARRAFRQRFDKAVGHWDGAAALVCTSDPSAPCCPRVPIQVRIVEVSSGEHHTIDVEDEERRPNVMEDVNVDQFTDEKTLTHEFGHVLGCFDEYHTDGVSGFFENYLPGFIWHIYGHEDDKSSVMNHGCEFRDRHFDRFVEWVNEARECEKGCKYEIELLRSSFLTTTWTATERRRLAANQNGSNPASEAGLANWLSKSRGMIRAELDRMRSSGEIR